MKKLLCRLGIHKWTISYKEWGQFYTECMFCKKKGKDLQCINMSACGYNEQLARLNNVSKNPDPQ